MTTSLLFVAAALALGALVHLYAWRWFTTWLAHRYPRAAPQPAPQAAPVEAVPVFDAEFEDWAAPEAEKISGAGGQKRLAGAGSNVPARRPAEARGPLDFKASSLNRFATSGART